MTSTVRVAALTIAYLFACTGLWTLAFVWVDDEIYPGYGVAMLALPLLSFWAGLMVGRWALMLLIPLWVAMVAGSAIASADLFVSLIGEEIVFWSDVFLYFFYIPCAIALALGALIGRRAARRGRPASP